MSELAALLQALHAAGGADEAIGDAHTAHLIALDRGILSSRTVPGLEVVAGETEKGIYVHMIVQSGARIVNPVHLCFGVLKAHETQQITIDLKLAPRSFVQMIAHCLFPNAERVLHSMNATISVGNHAELRYAEVHFHGPYGGTEVVPKAKVSVGEDARYCTEFTLTHGRVGKLDMDYDVVAGAGSVTEITARVFGHGADAIRIRDAVRLAGADARSIIKTRVAVEDDATAEITGITEGNAAGARGHVDCMEIVKDRAIARATPIVQVNNPGAKVTHEAAIGSVDKGQMETLMARGLSPDEATDLIVKGALR